MAGPLDHVHASLSFGSFATFVRLSLPPTPVGSSQLGSTSVTHPNAGSHTPVEQGGSQASGGPGTQAPVSHWSVVVHALPSSHAVPSGLGVPLQVPPPQTSLVVHWLPSSHGAVLAGCWQTPLPSQTSSVHSFASSRHPVPGLSNWHVVALQQSPGPWSSHCSNGSTTPLPQRLPDTVTMMGIPGMPNMQVPPPVNVRLSADAVAESAKVEQIPAGAPETVNAPVSGSTVPERFNAPTRSHDPTTVKLVPTWVNVIPVQEISKPGKNGSFGDVTAETFHAPFRSTAASEMPDAQSATAPVSAAILRNDCPVRIVAPLRGTVATSNRSQSGADATAGRPPGSRKK